MKSHQFPHQRRRYVTIFPNFVPQKESNLNVNVFQEFSPERKISVPDTTSATAGSADGIKPFKRVSLNPQKLSVGLTVEVNKSQSVPSETSEQLRIISHPKTEPRVSPGVPNTFDWTVELESCTEFSAAPVSSFRHVSHPISVNNEFPESVAASVLIGISYQVPVRGIWENVQPGMKLEVENRDANHSRVAFWVASVIRIHGKAQVRNYKTMAVLYHY